MNLIIGARGLLGSAVKRVLGGLSPTKDELDLTVPGSIDSYFQAQKINKIDTIINCAAISNVDKSETEGENALAVNALGPYYLAQACKSLSATLVHISTDYVFSNYEPYSHGLTGADAWTEEDQPKPTSTYGKIKLAGESLALINPKTYILRVSSLYGPDRSCHSEWVLNALKNGTNVNICEDMIGSPTYTVDLAHWIGDLLEVQPKPGIYHAIPNGTISRYDFATELLHQLGETPRVLNRIKMKDMNLPSERPNNPILSNEKWQSLVKKLPHWSESLERYTSKLKQKAAA